MRLIIASLFAALVTQAHAQNYPTPTFDDVTVNNSIFLPNCAGYLYGNGAAAATCATTFGNIPSTGNISTTARFYGTGATPSVSACGVSPAVSGTANDNHGTITTGTGTVNSCLLTWAVPRVAVPDCAVTPMNGSVFSSIVSTATSVTMTFSTSQPSVNIAYICMGQ